MTEHEEWVPRPGRHVVIVGIRGNWFWHRYSWECYCGAKSSQEFRSRFDCDLDVQVHFLKAEGSSNG